MGTTTKMKDLERSLDELLDELEAVGTEIELKMKLASMDVRDVWTKQLEPKLYEAKMHARVARDEAKHAVRDTLHALKDFAAAL